jgi:hypothetical protein
MASEVLKLATFRGDANSVQELIAPDSGKTRTVLSVTICETGNAAETFDLLVDDGGGGDDTYIYYNQALGAKETFEHTGRIVLEAADHLSIQTADTSNIDVVVSYLEQTL